MEGPTLDVQAGRALRDVRRFSREAMATVFEVYAAHPDERYAAQAAHAAFDLIDRLERELSRFVPNSDIARVNELQAGQGTRVSAWTIECLAIARHLFGLTGGAFDVSIGTGLPFLELDLDAAWVGATRGGVRVDLGAIGKGYAVDLAAELLEDWGVHAALIHGGFSSVLALDPPPDRDGWPVTFSDPAVPARVLVRRSVRQTALGASGLRKGDHIVEPRTGQPARGRSAAWVAVPRPPAAAADASAGSGLRVAAAAVSDALATAFMLLQPHEMEALCARAPGVAAWVLTAPAGLHPSQHADLLHFGDAV